MLFFCFTNVKLWFTSAKPKLYLELFWQGNMGKIVSNLPVPVIQGRVKKGVKKKVSSFNIHHNHSFI